MAKNKYLDQRFFTNGFSSSLANKLNLKKYINEVAKPYTGFTALLSIDFITLTEPTELVIGDEYIISELVEGDDFSNVGFEDLGVPFIATDTTPTVWTTTSVSDITNSQPSVDVLEDTITGLSVKYGVYSIGDKEELGLYIEKTGAFTSDKLYMTPFGYLFKASDDIIVIGIDTTTSLFPIEIRIYN